MGVLYEVNWYLVATNKREIKKISDREFCLEKADKRIYPINGEIPLIIKNIGCVGIVKINKLIIDKSHTLVYFETVANTF